MSFFDFFPTPKFLEMPAPGLALSDSGIKFIEFTSSGSHLSINRFGDADLPAGILEGGIIKDRDSLIRALEDFRKSFRLRHIRTSLPEERAYLFQTTVPRARDEELRTIVETTIEENVPLSVTESIFDFVQLETKEKDTPQIDVSVSALSEQVVFEYLSMFREAGFVPLHFDVESQAVARALVSSRDPDVFLIVNVHSSKAGFYLISDGAVTFTSTAVFPAVPHEEIKGESPLFAVLGEEMRKIGLYWKAQADRKNEPLRAIEKIILCGSEAGREGFTDHLGRVTDLPIELGNVWKNAFSFDTYIPDLTQKESLGYATAIGLALPHRADH